MAGTPVVITGFLLFRGPAGMPETKVFLQAYKKVGSVWEYEAETGDDMDHRGLFLREVKSPRVGEAWFLAYGNMTGYNGHLIRIRIYAFDGEKFTTVWSPPDRQDAQVKLEGDQLVVQYLDQKRYRELRKPPYTRTDRYVLDFSGAVELSSVLGPN